jgi:hypothetical protein
MSNGDIVMADSNANGKVDKGKGKAGDLGLADLITSGASPSPTTLFEDEHILTIAHRRHQTTCRGWKSTVPRRSKTSSPTRTSSRPVSAPAPPLPSLLKAR